MPGFKAWADTAIEDALAEHGGSMHWEDLQRALVRQYFHDRAQPSRHAPYESHAGPFRVHHVALRVLAAVPESHLSHKDTMVRMPNMKGCLDISYLAQSTVEQGVVFEDTSARHACRYHFRTASFRKWARSAINDALAKHGGSMHWRKVQRAVLQEYWKDVPKFMSAEAEQHVGAAVLAEIPEEYLSHENGLVQQCGTEVYISSADPSKNCDLVEPATTVKFSHTSHSGSSGRVRRRQLHRFHTLRQCGSSIVREKPFIEHPHDSGFVQSDVFAKSLHSSDTGLSGRARRKRLRRFNQLRRPVVLAAHMNPSTQHLDADDKAPGDICAKCLHNSDSGSSGRGRRKKLQRFNTLHRLARSSRLALVARALVSPHSCEPPIVTITITHHPRIVDPCEKKECERRLYPVEAPAENDVIPVDIGRKRSLKLESGTSGRGRVKRLRRLYSLRCLVPATSALQKSSSGHVQPFIHADAAAEPCDDEEHSGITFSRATDWPECDLAGLPSSVACLVPEIEMNCSNALPSQDAAVPEFRDDHSQSSLQCLVPKFQSGRLQYVPMATTLKGDLPGCSSSSVWDRCRAAGA
jgi:hypothetical protein